MSKKRKTKKKDKRALAEQPVEEVAEQPVEEVAEQPVEEVAEQPVEEVAEQPVEEVAEQPIEPTFTEKKTKIFRDHVDKVKAIARDKKIRGQGMVIAIVDEEKARAKDAKNASGNHTV